MSLFVDLFRVHVSKIADKTDAALLNYNNLYWGRHFHVTQCNSNIKGDLTAATYIVFRKKHPFCFLT